MNAYDRPPSAARGLWFGQERTIKNKWNESHRLEAAENRLVGEEGVPI